MTDPAEDQKQRDRIKRLAEELSPGCVVQFDPDSVWIRFRVTKSGIILINSSGEFHASEWADKSDDEIRKLLRGLSGGKM
jgi:hypothetical protein